MSTDVHPDELCPDELCPPNKQYDLMDVNKKEDRSKFRLKFMHKKELSLTLDDFRTIFHLPQANDNNHDSFMPPPSFLDMVPFYKQRLGFTMELKTSSSFKTAGLLMYAEVFGLYVSLTLSQPTESTHGTYRTSSAPRRSTRLTPPALVPIVDKADEMILQDTLQVSLAEHKSREEQEARENVELVNKHLASEEIEKMMEGSENVIDDSLSPRNDEPNILGIRLKPKSDKESPKVEITNDEEVEITNVVIHVNVNDEEEEITDEVKSFDTLADHLQEVMVQSLPIMVDKHFKEQVKKQVPGQVRDQVPVYVAEGLILERQKTKKEMERMIAKAILQERRNIQAEISSQIQNAIDNHIPSQVDASMKFERLQVPQTTCRTSAVRPRDQDDPHDDAHPEGENSAKRQKTSEYEAYVSGESSSGQVNEEERGLSTSVSLTIDEAKLKKMADEMLRRRCTSGDEHQYHIDQMKNFLKSDIIVARRANECIVSITEPDYNNLNKNDIEDMYLLIMNGKVPDYAETWLLWSLSVFIRSSVIWERVHDFQLGIESYQQKVNITAPIISFPGVEKHKIVLKGLKSYNNDVKHGYVQSELTNDEVEYLKLFEEEIEVRLKYHNQMRRWEMYVNGRPLGPRRERPE
ncbi:hypothetical protein Tco_0907612 [Tanacetum coccineum]|uniref:Uncharacterized protein n=1 Tax=Tanacetum coccineum TaxID=301880 RepID=A0ABQ5CL78_9ASTR